ncbi:MAG: glycosyltransferase family 39 protein, partial [Oscillospiraceae bacterium]|nr:glycosyltransferase family 39 protein [Oscillospiraceae bacterium]
LFIVFAAYSVNVHLQLKPRYSHVIIFAISLLFQLLISLHYTFIGEGDLRHYYNNASALVENHFQLPSLYAAVFPGTITYPAVLAVLMTLFGTGRIVAAVANGIGMSFALCCVYAILKRRVSNKLALFSSLLLSLHPFILIYSNTVNAELLYGAFILYSLTAFDAAMHTEAAARVRRVMLYSLSALFLGCSVLFRPLGIILLAAYCLTLLLFPRGRLHRRALVAAGLGCVFFLCNLMDGYIVKQITTFDPPKQAYGWNLYVGLSKFGTWNQSDADEFTEVIHHASTSSEVQTYFAAKAFERMRELGFDLVPHALKKIKFWNPVRYVASEVRRDDKTGRHSMADSQNVVEIAAFSFDTPIFLIGLIGCVWGLVKRRKSDLLSSVIAFYITGTFLALSILESGDRYTISHHILLVIPAVLFVADMLTLSQRKQSRGRIS